jgi:hypothetical protein
MSGFPIADLVGWVKVLSNNNNNKAIHGVVLV